MKEITTALIKEQFNPPLTQRENQLVDQIEDLCCQINNLKYDYDQLKYRLEPRTYTKLVSKDMLTEAFKKASIDTMIFGGEFGPIIKINNVTYNTKEYKFDSMEELVKHFSENNVIILYEYSDQFNSPPCEHCAKFVYIIRVYVKADIQETFPQCDEVSCIAKYVEKELVKMVGNSPELSTNWGDPFDDTWRN